MSKIVATSVTAPGIFDRMDVFEMTDSTKMALSIRIQFAKFAHGINTADFETFIQSLGGKPTVSCLGRLSFPNEWQLTLSSLELREELIRLGRTRINNRSCWIHPLSNSEIRGFVHWLPNEIPHISVSNILRQFGEIMFMETQNYTKFNYKIASDARYFALYLKPGAAKEDLPHFIRLNGKMGLVTVRGRQPACFHCRQVGHRKNECKTYREKLGEYCLRPPGSSGKREKRGRRHKKGKDVPKDNGARPSENLNSGISTSDLNISASEGQILSKSDAEAVDPTALSEGLPTKPKKNKHRKKSKKKKVSPQNSPTVTQDGEDISSAVEQCEKNESFTEDNFESNVEVESSTFTNISVFSESACEIHDLDASSAANNVPSTLKENTQPKDEDIDLKNNFIYHVEDESAALNEPDSSEKVSAPDADFSNHSVSSLNTDNVENLSDSVPFYDCSKENLKNSCNTLTIAKDLKDSSTNTDCNSVRLMSEGIPTDVKHQIGEILNNFMLQITDVLSEAGVANVSEIKRKLLTFNDALFSKKPSTDDKVCTLIEHDQDKTSVDRPSVPKVNKKKKKKAKKSQE